MTKRRSKRAAALLTVLIISVVSMIFLMALASIVTSAVKAASSDKWVEGLRNCAEVGVDYAVDKFNTVYPCPLDPSTSGTLTTILPASELTGTPVNGATPHAGAGISIVTVTLKVTRLRSTDWAWLQNYCTVYSPQIDPNNSSSNGWLSPASTNITNASGGGFRIVESTASNGIISRTVRVVLKARFGTPPDGSKPLQSLGSSPTQNNYFQQPLFGNSSVDLSGGKIVGIPDSLGKVTHLSTDGTTTSYNLNVMSNSAATMKNNTLLSGDLTIASSNSGSNPVLSTPSGTVEGRVTANGIVDDLNVIPYTASGNVQARAENPTGVYDAGATRTGDNLTPITIGSSVSQGQISPIATPSSASVLTDLSNYVGAGNSPTNDGTVFQTSTLSTNGVPAGQSVVFDNLSSPVQIFVDQGSTSANAVNIDTAKITTTSTNPADFQIWYEGNKPVNINLTSNFSGLIYAPNARVTISDTGGSPTYYGAAVGKNLVVNLNTGSVAVATGLATNGYGGGGGSANPATFKYMVRAGEGTVIQGWQPITWQEFGAGL